MLSRLTHSIVAVALVLTAHGSIPGWTTAAIAASTGHKCTAKSHRHVKTVAIKPAQRGSGVVQIRRSPDVQVLSFGP